MSVRFVHVDGICPSCGSTSLFIALGSHVTCARLDCPDPAAADDLLHDLAAMRLALEVRQAAS